MARDPREIADELSTWASISSASGKNLLGDAADAISALADERDELKAALMHKADDAYRAGYAAGSGENQP